LRGRALHAQTPDVFIVVVLRCFPAFCKSIPAAVLTKIGIATAKIGLSPFNTFRSGQPQRQAMDQWTSVPAWMVHRLLSGFMDGQTKADNPVASGSQTGLLDGEHERPSPARARGNIVATQTNFRSAAGLNIFER